MAKKKVNFTIVNPNSKEDTEKMVTKFLIDLYVNAALEKFNNGELIQIEESQKRFKSNEHLIKNEKSQEKIKMKNYTAKEVASMFNVTVCTVRKWLRDGKLTGIKLEKTYVITDEDISKFEKARRN